MIPEAILIKCQEWYATHKSISNAFIQRKFQVSWHMANEIIKVVLK